MENLATEIISRVIGCHSQMGKFDFFFRLHLGHRLYSHTDNLSNSLQSEKMSVATSKRLANLTVSLVQSIRVEESFESFYNAVLKERKNCHLFQSQSYPVNVVPLIIPFLITLVVVVIKNTEKILV